MPKDQMLSEIDTELAEVQAQIAAAGKEADRHDADYFECLDADPPDLNGAERSAAARDRALLERTAFERRVPALEEKRKAAAEREASEATAAAKKALEDKIAASETAMIATFGGDALARQVEVLKATAARDQAAKDAKTPAAALARAQAAGRGPKIHGGGGLRPGGAPFSHQHFTLEQQAKIAFDTVPTIRAEFGTLQRYFAYRRWDAGETPRGANGVAA